MPLTKSGFKAQQRFGSKYKCNYILIFVRHFSDWKFDVLYRVRLEKGDDGKERGGKIQNTADTQQVTATAYSNTAVVGAPVNYTGRAKLSSPMGDSIKSLASQLLGAHYFERDSDESERDSDDDGSDSMVDEDVRTPPKLKPQLKRKQGNQHVKLLPKTTEIPVDAHSYEDTVEETNHKGIAVPVIIEDDEDVERTIEKLSYTDPSNTRQTASDTNQKKKSTTLVTTTKPYYESTSSDGVSTWVLLSGSSSPTTPSHLSNKAKTHRPIVPSSHKSTLTTPTSELLKTTSSSAAAKVSYQDFGGFSPYRSTVTPSSLTRKPVRIGSLSSAAFTESAKPHLRQNETLEILKVSKTRKPNPTRVTTIKTSTATAPTTSISTSTMKIWPVSQQSNSQKAELRGTTISPATVTADRHEGIQELLSPSATVAALEKETTSSEESNLEDNSTDASSDTTTKRPTGGNKKRKNNKIRRRRPSNKPGVTEPPESKTDDVNTTFTKNNVATKERPLSTRIYNYLAREVMPSVGVGLIGLVVTAGLAGLIMYPFGGGLASRRTYAEQEPPHQLYYHHGDYDGEIDNSQSEEELFGKLLEGMNDKGEFTYSGIGDEATGIGRDQDSRYKTTSGSSVDDVQAYNSAGIRYGGGGRVGAETSGHYDSSQQGAASFAGSGKNEVPYAHSHGSQHHYGSSLRADNTQEMYQYGGMATRSTGIADTVRDSQHLYSGAVNAAAKQYTAGSIHLGDKPYQQAAVYAGPYYTPGYMESQAYRGWTATVGDVQADSKKGLRQSESTEIASEPKYKTLGISEGNSAGNEQYRRGISESRQQYRDGIGTQPRSGSSIITVSVTRQPGPRGKLEGTQTDLFREHDHTDKFSRNKQSLSERKHEEHKNQDVEDRTDGSQDSKKGPGDLLDISSEISSQLQKREPLTSGSVGHGPRNLRLKRDTNESTKFIVPDGDVRDNEIESNKPKHNADRNDIENNSQEGSNKIPTRLMPENTLTGNMHISEGIMKATAGNETTETVNISATSGRTDDTENVSTGISPTESATLEDELSTTTRSNDYDTGGEYADTQEEEEEYDTTISPEMTTASNETSTKDGDIEMTTKIPESQFSLLGLVRRIARFKLRIGLNLLKSTSQAFTNYIERVQRRMDKDYNSSNGSSVSARTFKRGS